jgi:hypothetical protein
MKLQFKFNEDATSEDRERLLASLTDDGVDAVERLFPDTDEVELALLYRALADDRNAKKLLRKLKRSRVIDYAEPQPERHLVMPIELEQQLNGARQRR